MVDKLLSSQNTTSLVDMASNDTDIQTLKQNSTTLTWSLAEKLILGTWLTISMLCAIFGNLMVIIVVIRHKGMRTRTNMFLVNLAVADFLVGILLAPFSLTTLVRDEWIFGQTMCNINGFMNAICLITSIHTLMYISIHKYVSITRPFSRILNNWKILVMISCAWLWAIICGVLTFSLNRLVYKSGTLQCGPEYPHNSQQYLHHVIITVTNFFIPLAIMTFAYARMYCEFRQHAIRLQKNTTLQADQILGQQIQVTKTLFIVLACFVLCWLPYAAYSTYVSMLPDKSKIPSWANPLAYCFMYMNSGCNPIIYAWRSPSFREGYKEILCQKSAYIVSDAGRTEMYTIRDTDSPSIIRRFSTLLHSSFMSSRNSTRRSSDASSVASTTLQRTTSASSPTHTLLRRATSKTAKGSSVIKKDGSLIITKNGKIISVRQDSNAHLKRDKSFSGFDAAERKRANGVSKSVSEMNVTKADRVELTPLLKRSRGHDSSSNSVSSQNSLRSNRDFSQHFHASLSKIESVDESEYNVDTENSSSDNNKKGELNMQLEIERPYNHSPSIKSDEDEVFIKSPIIINCNSEEIDPESLSLKPLLKPISKISKSEIMLDKIDNEPSHVVIEKGSKPSKHEANSTDTAFHVPLLRYPSIERLDLPPCHIPRCSSDATGIRKLRSASPLYKRRFLLRKKPSTEKA